MVGYMARHGLQRIKLKSGDLELELEKPQVKEAVYEMASMFPQPMPSVPQLGHAGAGHLPAPLQAPAASEGYFVNSPIVGTFYTSSTPGSAAFVKVGDTVSENTVVCIIEAMKVMNEVRAGKKGVLAEICVENGHPVEFGTKIMRIV